MISDNIMTAIKQKNFNDDDPLNFAFSCYCELVLSEPPLAWTMLLEPQELVNS